MKENKTKKIILTTLLPFAIVSHMHAQKSFQLTPQAGAAFAFLKKDIYSGKPLNISYQLGLEIKKPISRNVAIGLEGQYNQFNLSKNVEQTYQRFITNTSIRNFSPSTAINGILNLHYTKRNKSAKRELGIGLGAGVQQLSLKGNSLQIQNPFQSSQYATVYQQTKGKYSNPILQLTLEYNWYIRQCVAINIGIKAQYIKANDKLEYIPLPTDTNNINAFETLFNTERVITQNQGRFTLIPSIGIRFALGGCHKPKEQNQTASCFGLQWKNAAPKDSCFRGDTLQFAFAQNNLVPNATVYEIYIAPVNDLNNEKLLHTLPYPSNRFSINPILMDANREYVVIVKLKNSKKENECIQFIKPVKRCADCCKDVKLPE